MYMCMYMHVFVFVCMCVHDYMYMYVYVYVHMYMCGHHLGARPSLQTSSRPGWTVRPVCRQHWRVAGSRR